LTGEIWLLLWTVVICRLLKSPNSARPDARMFQTTRSGNQIRTADKDRRVVNGRLIQTMKR